MLKYARKRKMSIYILDWKRTLYNPDTTELIDGAVDLLKHLSQQIDSSLILVGKGSDEMHSEVKRLGVEDYFEAIRFQEGDKDSSLFIDLVDKNNPKKSIFIGDRVRSELAIGNSLGATTIWVKQGKFSDELPINPVYVPTYTVRSLYEILNIIV